MSGGLKQLDNMIALDDAKRSRRSDKSFTPPEDNHSLPAPAEDGSEIEVALQKAEAGDAGALFEPAVLGALTELRSANKAHYMRLRARIKKARGLSVTELERALSKGNSTEADHLVLARATLERMGHDSVIHTSGEFWTWRESGVWRPIEDREVKRAIHQVIEEQHGSGVLTRALAESVLDLTRTEAYEPGHRFDRDMTAINTPSGELHYISETWVLQSHNRDNFRTTQIPVAYTPGALAPRFTKFLEEIFDGDPDAEAKRQLVLELIGYSLMTTCRFEAFVLLIGAGANGKSVLLKIVSALVGPDHVAAVQPSQFDNRFQRAHLRGKLVNVVTEIAEGAEIADAQLKAIVSGELITAEHKMRPPFEFEPYSTCWFGTNHMPHTRDFSDALFRRAIILTFNRKFYGDDRDPHLTDKLLRELPGILNLAIDALADVLKRGRFTECQSSEDAKREWRLNADQVAQFVEDRCRLVPDSWLASGALYDAYVKWAHNAGVRRTLNRKNFVQRLERLGAVPFKGTGGQRRIGGIAFSYVDADE